MDKVILNTMCSLKLDEPPAQLIREANLIIWNEAPMSHKHTFEAVDSPLRDIMKEGSLELADVPFRGKVFVLGGDFRQVLPVVPRGRGQVVAASLRRSSLWQHIKVYKLGINMRVQLYHQQGDAATATAQQDFADFLLRVGDGTEAVEANVRDDMIRLPLTMCAATQDPAVY